MMDLKKDTTQQVVQQITGLLGTQIVQSQDCDQCENTLSTTPALHRHCCDQCDGTFSMTVDLVAHFLQCHHHCFFEVEAPKATAELACENSAPNRLPTSDNGTLLPHLHNGEVILGYENFNSWDLPFENMDLFSEIVDLKEHEGTISRTLENAEKEPLIHFHLPDVGGESLSEAVKQEKSNCCAGEKEHITSSAQVTAELTDENPNIENPVPLGGTAMAAASGGEVVSKDLEISLSEGIENNPSQADEPCSQGIVYQCNECIKSFSNKSRYESHLETHKLYCCGLCKAAFSKTMGLIRHMKIHIGRETFKCKDCGREFAQRRNLENHMRSHRERFACKTCGTVFTKQKRLEQHKTSHCRSTGKPFSCSECGAGFTQLGSLNRHKNIHADKRPHKCDQCPAAFTQSGNLRIHMRIHTGERPYSCELCGASFSQPGALSRHKLHHGVSNPDAGERQTDLGRPKKNKAEKVNDNLPHLCDQCGASFTSESSLHKHILHHTGSRPFLCEKCDSSFLSIASLERHRQMHNTARPHQCDKCGKTFSQVSSLASHRKSHFTDPKFACDICSERFVSKPLLTQHKKTHQDRPHKCKVCPSAFTKIKFLKGHMNTVHGKESNYACDECGETFAHSGSLTAHRQCHKNERPFQCGACDAAFMDVTGLRLHERIHKGERPFICRLCGAAFRQSSTLSVHMRVHTGEKPYKCKLCGKTFAQTGALKRHMKTHAGELQFTCPYCEAAFSKRYSLTSHLRRHT